MEAIEGLQYPYALDKGGLIVKAVDAPRSELYTCIACGERMVLRRGEIKRPHFAHYPENPNCAPETVLHKMAKDNIKAGIDTALSLKLEYPLTWRCTVCNQIHKGDLARSPREVRTEVSLDGVRPDVLLSSIKGKPLATIEVVVTHRLNKQAKEAYESLKIPVLLVRPGWKDLERLKRGLGRVEAWQAPCRAKHCTNCGRLMDKIEIGAFEGYKCYKCGKSMVVAALVGDKKIYFEELGPGAIKPAQSLGVIMARVHDEIDTRDIAKNQCTMCGNLKVRNWYDTEYIRDLEAQGKKLVSSKPYYRCKTCDIWIERQERAFKKNKGDQVNDRPSNLNSQGLGERGS